MAAVAPRTSDRPMPLPCQRLSPLWLEASGLLGLAGQLIDHDRAFYHRYWRTFAGLPHRPLAERHAWGSLRLDGFALPLSAQPDTPCPAPARAAMTALIQLHYHYRERPVPAGAAGIQALYDALLTACGKAQSGQTDAPSRRVPLHGLTAVDAVFAHPGNCDEATLVHQSSVHLCLHRLNPGAPLIGPFLRLYTELNLRACGVRGASLWGLPHALSHDPAGYAALLGDATTLPGRRQLLAFARWLLNRSTLTVIAQARTLDRGVRA